MEADLLGIPKPSSGPGKATVKGPGKCDFLGGGVKNTGKLVAPEEGKKEILLFFSHPDCKRAGIFSYPYLGYGAKSGFVP